METVTVRMTLEVTLDSRAPVEGRGGLMEAVEKMVGEMTAFGKPMRVKVGLQEVSTPGSGKPRTGPG